MTQKKRSFPIFWCIYALLLIAFVAFLYWGAGELKAYLTAFENSQPIHLAESVFQEYFTGDSLVPALEKSGYEPGEYESLEAPAAVLKAMQEGKDISYYSASVLGDEVRYNVVLTDQVQESETETNDEIKVQGIPSTKLATIYLNKREEADEYGFRGYEFTKLEMFVKPEKSVKVTAPSTSKLTINGKDVTADHVIGEQAHEFNAFLPQGVEGITLLTYEVTGLYEEPTLALVDRNGMEQTLVQDEKTGAFDAKLNYDSALQEQQADRILTGMKEFAKHMQNDGGIGPVSRYFDTSSMFYRNIAYNLSQFVWDHNGYEFRNEVVENFYAFDENTFCCHVAFDHVLKLYGREDYVDSIDMIIFAKKKGNNFYIYDRIVQ
ncbi:MAG: hypothetical protein IKJ74_01780 [Clostridia bacterium]|nr:hypothetical protein [Clostridia bacterium]